MKNKIVLVILSVFLMFLIACQQATKKEMQCTLDVVQCPDGSYVGRAGPNCEFEPCPTTPTAATGDAAVDAVGNDLNSVDSVEKDLGIDELSDLDSGLSDIQNI